MSGGQVMASIVSVVYFLRVMTALFCKVTCGSLEIHTQPFRVMISAASSQMFRKTKEK